MRWLVFIPAGIVITALLNFPIHWIVLLVGLGCPSPGSAVSNPLRFLWCFPEMVEHYVLAFLNPLGVILLGSWIAPAHRFRVSIGLACMLAAGFLGMYYVVFNYEVAASQGLAFPYSGLGWLEFGAVVVLNISGILTSVFIVKVALALPRN